MTTPANLSVRPLAIFAGVEPLNLCIYLILTAHFVVKSNCGFGGCPKLNPWRMQFELLLSLQITLDMDPDQVPLNFPRPQQKAVDEI